MVASAQHRGTFKTSRGSNKMRKVKKNKRQVPLGRQNLMHITAFRLPHQFPSVSMHELVCSPLANDQVPSVCLNSVTACVSTVH